MTVTGVGSKIHTDCCTAETSTMLYCHTCIAVNSRVICYLTITSSIDSGVKQSFIRVALHSFSGDALFRATSRHLKTLPLNKMKSLP